MGQLTKVIKSRKSGKKELISKLRREDVYSKVIDHHDNTTPISYAESLFSTIQRMVLEQGFCGREIYQDLEYMGKSVPQNVYKLLEAHWLSP